MLFHHRHEMRSIGSDHPYGPDAKQLAVIVPVLPMVYSVVCKMTFAQVKVIISLKVMK